MSLIIEKSNSNLVRFTLALGVILFAFFLAFSLRDARAADPNERLVKIHDEEVDTSIITRADTVAEALDQADISTSPYDNIDPSLDTKLTDTTYQVNIYRARPVMVVDGLKRKLTMTAYDTPEQIAKDAEMPLYDEDVTKLSRSSNVIESEGAGLILDIDRAARFTLVLYGKPIETGTQATSVGDMLQEKNIKLSQDDTVSLHVDTPISQGMRVEIWRNGKQTATVEEPIAFSVQQIQDSTKPLGYREVKTPGVLGKKVVTYEIEMRNGQEVARNQIQSVQTLAPQAQVEIVGAKGTFSGSFGEALARLRSCEGSYTTNTGNGYYGAYQFDIGTWGGYQGYPHAAAAPPAVQDQKAWETYQRRGWKPWPACSRKVGLQDIYR